ncbi:MAG: zinc-binding dehydrogenase, partial [Candidatus Freyarchaeota archaeon]
KIKIEEVDKPKVTPGSLLVKIMTTTTCGTDLKTFVRGYPGKEIKFPMPLGHESVGEIVEVGEGARTADGKEFKVGQRVAFGMPTPCYGCYFCKKGQYSLCENMTMPSVGFREYGLIPPQTVKYSTYLIPDDISYEEAAQLEPLSSAVYGNMLQNIKKGDIVAIIGSGAQGIYHMLLAKLSGASEVIMIDLNDYRLGCAKKMGADYIVNSSKEDPVQKVKELTEGRGADVVVETAGTTKTWEQAIEMVRKGGLVDEYAGCEAGTYIKVSTEKIHYGQITILGHSHKTPYSENMAWNLIVNKQLDLKSIVTHKMRLDDLAKAYELLMTTKKALKIAIIP